MLGFAAISSSQTFSNARITQRIDNSQRIVLSGNTHPDATAANDAGVVDSAKPLTGLQLVLKRSPAAQTAFTQYIADLTNPTSPNFHKWLTNQEIGEKYGPSSADITKISDWLSEQGFQVHGVSPDGMVLEFSGTAAQVASAFSAPLHKVVVNGAAHYSNMRDPQMPAALSPVVSGIAKLNDFQPHSLATRKINKAGKISKGNAGGGEQYLSAADLAIIYNFNPAFHSGITGKGQTIVVVEDTNQYSLGDWSAFRKVLGLSRSYPYATITQVNPAGSSICGNPGVNGDDGEAAIDIEWASAAAPNAAIVSAACANTSQFGGFLALANLLQAAHPAQIVSISYGEAEAELGAAENLYISNLYQAAVAEGVSVFVSSGDEGAASADANQSVATHGIGVSGFTSTPYDISVGGTDFGNVALNSPGTYFSSTDGPFFQSALSYIPEIPWNDSCTGALISAYYGYPTTGTGSICNVYGDFLTTASGSGGPSGCATGTPTTSRVVSGTCAGYAKPSWQSLVGVPADGVRDIPDVSLMASNGFWEAYYAVCYSDPGAGFGPCGADPINWAGYGGTSISSPIWAGIQALVNQSTGTSWGNSNPVLYTLANTEYGSSGSSACNSSLGNAVGANCVFYDVTQGDMAVDCKTLSRVGFVNCYNDGGTYGVLSVSNTTKEPAYGTNAGWDFATGIGTTNASNLVNAWTTYSMAHPH
jgi:subtilase family serine protease